MNSFIWKNPANGGGGGNITQLEQKVQQLEQTIQNLTQQIQTLTQDLANKAGKAEANTFTNKQKITYPNNSLSMVQDNNAIYVSFEEASGARRGYVGMGSSNSNKIHLDGKAGVQITSTTGDLELNPAGFIRTAKEIIYENTTLNRTTPLTFNSLKKFQENGNNVLTETAFNIVSRPGSGTTKLGLFSRAAFITSITIFDVNAKMIMNPNVLLRSYKLDQVGNNVIMEWNNANSEYNVSISYIKFINNP